VTDSLRAKLDEARRRAHELPAGAVLGVDLVFDDAPVSSLLTDDASCAPTPADATRAALEGFPIDEKVAEALAAQVAARPLLLEELDASLPAERASACLDAMWRHAAPRLEPAEILPLGIQFGFRAERRSGARLPFVWNRLTHVLREMAGIGDKADWDDQPSRLYALLEAAARSYWEGEPHGSISATRAWLAQLEADDAPVGEGDGAQSATEIESELDARGAIALRARLAPLLRLADAMALVGDRSGLGALSGLLRTLIATCSVAGDEHPLVALCLNRLSLLMLRKRGSERDAIEIARHALEIQDRLLGPDHPLTRLVRANLAACYVMLERPEDAAALLEDPLAPAPSDAHSLYWSARLFGLQHEDAREADAWRRYLVAGASRLDRRLEAKRRLARLDAADTLKADPDPRLR
jgi:hypothetical protein